MTHINGVIIAAHGRHYLAQTEAAKLQCVTRGKKSDVAVGDIVNLQMTSANQAVIESIAERKTLLYRSDQYKSKLLAANLTQLFIVVATEPSFSDDLISRALVAADAAGIAAMIILNKIDVTESLFKTRERLALYAALGYQVHEVSARTAPDAACEILIPLLQGQSSILIGQSGMGKSSLINLIVPDADIAVREISAALDTGKHTTTFTRLYTVDQDTSIIDSPGFQEFGLQHIPQNQLAACMPDLKEHAQNCKFYNCTHLHEPGCGVLAALQKDESADLLAAEVSHRRHRIYTQLFEELGQQRW